ncbi:hypothetical protein [Noviherbaspirillum pedocola]|uniref:Uncharacterized protein n=1 Tax=Noviherbaspirillum pedocola TaxID=2801341 RepID=A0A934T3P5_9BURK|nr:hypothetical protein [Noviherbaspirillum pedocola]MBK4739139.1 hypothetical protein [Noviherbaspirillum pedocola]
MTTSVYALPIKWTDDEWNKIAVQLYHLKGRRALAPDGVEDIKARDVFEAQNILPVERRRKQISIAQGFQAIRTRLRGLFERGQQNHLFPALAPPAHKDVTSASSPSPVAQASVEAPVKELRTFDAASHDLFADGGVGSNEASDDVGSARMLEVSGAAGLETNRIDEIVPLKKTMDQEADEARPSATIAPTTSARVFENVHSFSSKDNRGNQLARRAEPSRTSLTELARPFVAMVCEELARALVQTFSGQELTSATSRLPTSAVQTARQSEEPRSRRGTEQVSNDSRFPMRDDNLRAGWTGAFETGDDEIGHPAEVQPLFDPKLPPSANSDFKPMIGLVATRDHEFEDLQLLYPQLRFSIVPAEDIRGPEVFRDCQRVIGLREEVPHGVEEVLKRALGFRYIWVRGGPDRVREQLDAWLANPASMQAGPRRQAPRNEKRVTNSNAKKRAKWPPRVA